MPYLVHWTANALAGLARVRDFLAAADPGAAEKALDVIIAATDILHEFPHAGRPADDLEPDYREVLIPFGVSGYTLVYELRGHTVVILALKHQREAGYLD
ncbi:type II toxin-antitoxin system RelE/ParE family toxin [Desulfovibrio sp.]|uniref:type II toxin-antitoxin system RelE/ParE family toxin n=1 Tax=Desulfovibrio sp. TaxID=885 RepID=UPI0023CABFBE|nr:type II toxin-antitoxin system RelE/ParE family toxin [Desulfovibrio sp.]MDE7241387.1 type II toxin-antitoxin system RelE/ParE family toxin [Desulfovibrio sp.]